MLADDAAEVRRNDRGAVTVQRLGWFHGADYAWV